MSTIPTEPAAPGSAAQLVPASDTRQAFAWTTFLFALLQSICGAVVAINGLRLAIGIGSLASAGVSGSGAIGLLVRFHANWIRVPMISLALVGSLFDLAILLHVRYLRNRPAARWRRRELSRKEIGTERLQWMLSVLTLLLIAVEEYLHLTLHHSL